MPDLDGGRYCPPLDRSRRFPSYFLRLNRDPFQIGGGHARYRRGMLAKQKKEKARKNKTGGER